ncbi:MAG: hypothetical protein V1790_03820 [Planctomycetota bacterium]
MQVHPLAQSITLAPVAKSGRGLGGGLDAAPVEAVGRASVAPAATPPPSDLEPVDGVTPAEPEDQDADDGKASGVLRLIEAGHFQGVADVRLRINFFEELSSRAAANAGPVLAEQSQVLTDAVGTQVDAALKPLATNEHDAGAIDGIVTDFDSAVATAVGGATSAGSVDSQTLSDAIQSAFDAMISRMRELLTAPAPDATPTSDVNSGDSGTALDGAIQSLSAAFAEALAKLVDGVRTATSLPDPSPPRHGNGSAYDKFLAIYNDLRGVSTTVDQNA